MDFLARKAHEHATAKRQQWADIQARAPGLAADLTALHKAFGKVRLVSVEFRDGGA